VGAGLLPAEVGEGAVRLGHLVRVFLSSDTAGVVVGIDDLGARASSIAVPLGPWPRHDPAQRKALLALKRNFDGHLVGGATDAAALDLERGGAFFQRAEQQVDRVALLQLLRNLSNAPYNEPLGKVLPPLMMT